jgi:hypothetical protein
MSAVGSGDGGVLIAGGGSTRGAGAPEPTGRGGVLSALSVAPRVGVGAGADGRLSSTGDADDRLSVGGAVDGVTGGWGRTDDVGFADVSTRGAGWFGPAVATGSGPLGTATGASAAGCSADCGAGVGAGTIGVSWPTTSRGR